MRGRILGVSLCVSFALLTGRASAAAQGWLSAAAERARVAWLAHDPEALVGQSGSVVLQLPGAHASSPLGRAQAAEVLRRHWSAAVERSLAVSAIREVASGKGYVELARRYVVSGTADERRETIFLEFRQAGHDGQLVELRSAP
jgi:hypothetical protein